MNREQVIDEVARRAAPVFAAEEWCWHDATEPPNKEQIARFVRRLLDDIGTNTTCIRSGRFRIDVERDEGTNEVEAYNISLELGWL